MFGNCLDPCCEEEQSQPPKKKQTEKQQQKQRQQQLQLQQDDRSAASRPAVDGFEGANFKGDLSQQMGFHGAKCCQSPTVCSDPGFNFLAQLEACDRKAKRADYLSWDDFFLTVAFMAAQRSKD